MMTAKRTYVTAFLICTLVAVCPSGIAAQESPQASAAPGSAGIFVVNLDSLPRSIHVDDAPATLAAENLPPSGASPLASLDAAKAHTLYVPAPGGAFNLLRNQSGQFYEYRFEKGGLYGILLLPEQVVRVVKFTNPPQDSDAPRILFGNSTPGPLVDMQLASSFNTNILVYLAELPAATVSNPAKILWQARYGVFYADPASPEGFKGIEAKPEEYPEFTAGSLWIAVANQTGVVLTRLK